MALKIITHNSEEYDQMVALRMKVLRQPLGLSFSDADLEKEKNDILIGAFDGKVLTGCCVLTKKNKNIIQLRQMAVAPDKQHTGIGTAIIHFAEKTAREKGFSNMIMHARNEALPFYEKCGYTIAGEEFVEVNIPHHKMEKKLP